MRRVLLALLGIVVIAVGWLVYRLNDRPSLDSYAQYFLVEQGKGTAGRKVSVTFLGVSTVLISDGETAIMTDGFFTRPPLTTILLGKVKPDRETIARSLARAGVQRLAAVIVTHSHYDHAMDAPEVARQTGAILVGSESTANIGRGWGLPEERIHVVRSDELMLLGGFEVTLVRSKHLPQQIAMGDIWDPLVPPARAWKYLDGGSYSVLLKHELGSLLLQGSAGYVDGGLDSYRADVVLLSVGGLGTKDKAYMEAYFHQVADAVGAKRVMPIHYDDFTLSLDQPLHPMPTLIDDFDASMAFLIRRAEANPKIELGILPVWRPVTLFTSE